MEATTVFRAQFIIAWPIWAGGYPTPEQALQVVEQHKAAIVAMFNERLHSLLGEEFSSRNFSASLEPILQLVACGRIASYRTAST